MSVQKITKATFTNEVLNSEQTVLVDFYADWCGPCKMLSPILDTVAKEATNAKVVKVNVDEERELAQQYNVMSIPTLVILKQGKLVAQSAGLQSKEAILKMLG